MSLFSSVDSWVGSTPDADRVVAYLDYTARAATGIKHYAMAKHTLRNPQGLVLDLGCGAGHDLELLDFAGVPTVGLDSSAVLLRVARERVGDNSRLVQGVGEALPFRDASLAGCRIERVLQHVASPGGVLDEVVRCLRPGALLTVYEPDWSSFRVRGPAGDEVAEWISNVRHPAVGGALWDLFETAGVDVLDRVEERSVWRSLETLDRAIGLDLSVERAVRAGRIGRADADRWVSDQRARESGGEFRSTLAKILVVGQKR